MGLDIRAVQEGDEEQVARFYYRAAGVSSPPEYWRWKYFESPAGAAAVFIALDHNQIVGRFGILPIKARINGKEVLAAEVVDGDVLQSYRKGGLLFELVASARQAAMEKGTRFEFGFGPQEKTAIGFRTLGAGLVAPVHRVVKIVFPLISALAGAAATNVQVKEIRYFDPSFDELWKKWRGGEIAVVRDSAYLNWRYLKCPVADYKVFTAERSGELSGFAVLEIFNRGWLRCGNIVDIFSSQDDEVPASLLLAAIRYFAQRGVLVAIAWVPQHSSLLPVFREMGFHSFPSWVNIGARSCQEQEIPQTYLEDERHWHYAIGDKDYFPAIRRMNWK
ncbi:MAG: GNAT family N-acetyltransferase [Deltaproteobacteria bacterium]|nr:GNAT family N-acetyltransferase [Deltaproteobacteria bacterium]